MKERKNKGSSPKVLPGSPQKVRRLLESWQSEGLLSQDAAMKIAECYPQRTYTVFFAFFCSVLGVCLLGIGVAWAIAAGWFTIFVLKYVWVYSIWVFLALSLLLGAFQLPKSNQSSGKITALWAPILSFFLIAAFQIAFGRAYQLPNDVNRFYVIWFWAAFPLAFLHRSFLLLCLNNLVWNVYLLRNWGWFDGTIWFLLAGLAANVIYYGYYYQSTRKRAIWGFAQDFCAQLTLLLVWWQIGLFLLKVADMLGLDPVRDALFIIMILDVLAFAANYLSEYARHSKMLRGIAWFLLISQLFLYSSPMATMATEDIFVFTDPFFVLFWLLFAVLLAWTIC